MTKNYLMKIVATFGLLILPLVSFAADVEVTASYAGISPNNVVEIEGDAAPGFPDGSIASDGSGKTQFTFTPEQLFGKEITMGEIESISYWTKKDTNYVSQPGDWYLQIYTKPYEGDVSPATWYGERITAEPYFSQNLNATVDDWNQWSTGGAENTLRFFDSALGYFGGYADPVWSDYIASNAFSGETVASREVLIITIQTGSGWADGFEGQVDGLVIELLDDTVGTVNFETETPFVRSAEITMPGAGEEVSGIVDLAATLVDEDGDDSVQWAVRAGTCAAGTGTVAGNVDGFTDSSSWDGANFTASVDMTLLPVGAYCFVFNPTESAGDTPIRLTREFILTYTDPTEKNQCMKDGWMNYGFKNQGQCVRFVETGKDSRE